MLTIFVFLLLTHIGSAESWAARAALWAQQRHVEQHYAQQYQQQHAPQQQQTYPPLPPENAPPLPSENTPPAPHPPEPTPPGQPPVPDLQPPGDSNEGEGEPAPPGNDPLYPPGEDPSPEQNQKQTSDIIEVAPMEEDDISQSLHPHIQQTENHQHLPHQGDGHHYGDQNNHADHFGNPPHGDVHGHHHGGQFNQNPPAFHENHHFDGGYQSAPVPHGGFPPEQYHNDQHGQFSNFNHNHVPVDQQLYPSDPNNYQQYNYTDQQQYGHFDQNNQGGQPEYHQQPKPLLQTEIPVSSLPSHVVQGEAGWLCLHYFFNIS